MFVKVCVPSVTPVKKQRKSIVHTLRNTKSQR